MSDLTDEKAEHVHLKRNTCRHKYITAINHFIPWGVLQQLNGSLFNTKTLRSKQITTETDAPIPAWAVIQGSLRYRITPQIFSIQRIYREYKNTAVRLELTAFKVTENSQMFCASLMQNISIILPWLPEPTQSELVHVEVRPVHLRLDSAFPHCSPHTAEVERGHPGGKL